VGLYVGSDNRLKEMVYHRGSPKSPVPALVTVTWRAIRKLALSSSRRSIAGWLMASRCISTFRNVAVKLVGSDTWINAH
jgi:hypothetical protein